MSVQNLECPNCGAPIDFADSTAATCPYCNSHLTLTNGGVTASGTLSDLVERSTSPPGIDLEQIRQLLRDGNKIGAIKFYREQTGVGLREAKEAVEAIERGEAPAAPIDQQSRPVVYRSRRATTSRAGCLGCLPVLVFIGLCAGFIMLSSQVMFRAFGPLEQALQIINSDPAVVRALGKPITPGAMVTGEISGGNTSSSADFSLPIYGPKRSGELNVSGNWRRSGWNLSIWVTYEDEGGEEQTISITRQVK